MEYVGEVCGLMRLLSVKEKMSGMDSAPKGFLPSFKISIAKHVIFLALQHIIIRLFKLSKAV